MLFKVFACCLLLHLALAETSFTAGHVKIFRSKVFVYGNRDEGEDLTYTATRDWCHGMGGKLPSVHSRNEMEVISDHGHDNKSFWLGGHKEAGQKWTWDDGSEWDFEDIGFNSCESTGTPVCLLCASSRGSINAGKMCAVHDGGWQLKRVCQFDLRDYLEKFVGGVLQKELPDLQDSFNASQHALELIVSKVELLTHTLESNTNRLVNSSDQIASDIKDIKSENRMNAVKFEEIVNRISNETGERIDGVTSNMAAILSAQNVDITMNFSTQIKSAMEAMAHVGINVSRDIRNVSSLIRDQSNRMNKRFDESSSQRREEMREVMYRITNETAKLVNEVSSKMEENMVSEFQRHEERRRDESRMDSEKLDRLMEQLSRMEDGLAVQMNTTVTGNEDKVNLKLDVLKVEVYAVPAAFVLLILAVALIALLFFKRKQADKIEPVRINGKGFENLYCEL